RDEGFDEQSNHPGVAAREHLNPRRHAVVDRGNYLGPFIVEECGWRIGAQAKSAARFPRDQQANRFATDAVGAYEVVLESHTVKLPRDGVAQIVVNQRRPNRLLTVQRQHFAARGLRERSSFELLAPRVGDPDSGFVPVPRAEEEASRGLAVDRPMTVCASRQGNFRRGTLPFLIGLERVPVQAHGVIDAFQKAVRIGWLKMNRRLRSEEAMAINDEFISFGDPAKDSRIVENKAVARRTGLLGEE